ncbi:MAG: RNA polymerase sigma-54 factor [Lentisphaerae bacterium GWF2_45_14]|nr:MAG: RNA polymerase sigma-54 factor [Lentisphaerae bacterium GWF2_45_14]
MTGHNLIQSQELRQEQILAPQQIQSLEILLTPMLQLQEKINQELSENPVLELEKPPGEELASDMEPEAGLDVESSDDGGAIENRDRSEDAIDSILKLADSWRDFPPPQHSRNDFSDDDEEKRQHFFDSIVEETSLQEQLLEQLRFSDSDPLIGRIAELIIGSIDDSGYLRSHLADLATASESDIRDAEKALKLVQSFEPPGIGARDLRECLLIQLERRNSDDKLIIQLVSEHLDDIAKNRIVQVAKKMRQTPEQIYALINTLKNLNPYPGAAISHENPIFVIPEVIVEKINGEYVITSNDEQLPRLKISGLYLKLLDNPDTPHEAKEYIKSKLMNGKMLLKSLEQRQSTIRRIAEVVVDNQYDFLEKGIEFLKPMTMQQVADKLGMHETTISRAIANKYIKIPGGLFEFRFFFSFGYHASDGEELSSKSVKEKIREFVMKENPENPLSDSVLSQMLKEQGIPVARRTVAKYREEMGIQSSHLRKEFA